MTGLHCGLLAMDCNWEEPSVSGTIFHHDDTPGMSCVNVMFHTSSLALFHTVSKGCGYARLNMGVIIMYMVRAGKFGRKLQDTISDSP